MAAPFCTPNSTPNQSRNIKFTTEFDLGPTSSCCAFGTRDDGHGVKKHHNLYWSIRSAGAAPDDMRSTAIMEKDIICQVVLYLRDDKTNNDQIRLTW